MARKKKNNRPEGRERPAAPRGGDSPSAQERPATKAAPAVAVLLALVTLALFAAACGFDFVNYDDNKFVTENRHVQGGFTPDNIAWAFTNHDAYLWHPLTWFTHMLDFKLYGLKAAGHHLTNILIHAATTALLFLTLRRMTGALWRSAIVAALFAWHPLHVQSVAWVAERKDVLSGFFWVLTLWGYARYVERPGWFRYLQVLLWLALGLMSKPMVVTLPCVLLLLDVWPLRRINLEAVTGADVWKLVREKIPMFVLVGAVSVLTVRMMDTSGALTSTETLSLQARIVNSLTSYVRYFGQIFWPANLSVFYPLPKTFPLWLGAGMGLILLAVSAATVRLLRTHGAVAVGWFWFLGTMVPTIGLLQNGGQSMADRYTYIPYIGAFIALIWGAAALGKRLRWPPNFLATLAAIALLACMILTFGELKHWRNSVALFTRALEVTQDNYIAHYNLAIALDAVQKTPEAVEQYRMAVKLYPNLTEARQNLAAALVGMGKNEEAIIHYKEVLLRKPDHVMAHIGLAMALDATGQSDEAIAHLHRALQLKPTDATAHTGLGLTLMAQGKVVEAATAFREALRYSPNLTDAQIGLGTALVNQGSAHAAEAIAHYQEALRARPNSSEAYSGIGMAYALLGQLPLAEANLKRALELSDEPSVRSNLANTLVMQNKLQEAITHFSAALKQNPNWASALDGLARILAMSGDARLRDGKAALELSQRACVLTQSNQPNYLDTLAAAYAECGYFQEAVTAAQRAVNLSMAAGNTQLAEQIQERLKLYQNKQPFHDTPK